MNYDFSSLSHSDFQDLAVIRSKIGKPEIRTVLGDITGLTKINYNSCNFNDGLPVTVRFARMVGDVLTMGQRSEKNASRSSFMCEHASAFLRPASPAQCIGDAA
jgi:hypothetical protein